MIFTRQVTAIIIIVRLSIFHIPQCVQYAFFRAGSFFKFCFEAPYT